MSGQTPPPLPPRRTPPPPPPLPAPAAGGPELARARFVEAARELVRRNHSEAEGEGCVTAVVMPVLVLMGLTIVLLPLALRLYRRWRLVRRVDERNREAEQFAEHATPVMAFPLMVNSMLRRPGTGHAPGLFLISFDPRRGNSIRFMGELGERVGGGHSGGMSYEDYEFCRGLMADEQYRPFRRRRIPDSLTGGAAVYAVDLAVSQLLLAGRHIADEMPLVPCMAEPGDDGRIVQMPYWLLTDGAPPGEAERETFEMTLTAIGELSAMARGEARETA